MKKHLLLLLLFTGLLGFGQVTPDTSVWDKIPPPKGVVTDYEHLFTDKEILALTELITKFEKETTIEIALVTINPELTPKERFEEFTRYIADKWGVGKKDKNNGILIGISKGYHRIRIQNGDGVKTLLTDEQTYRIIQEFFIPQFKEDRYFFGTRDGVEEIIRRLKDKLQKK